MKRSTDRILTSHAGSLHRPDDLRDTMAARRDGDPFDAALEQRVADAIKEVVRLQHENGVDIVNDGEYTKKSWQTYARGRLSGLEFRALGPDDDRSYGSITARESQFFPEFFARNPMGGGAGAGSGVGNTGAAAQAPQGVFITGPLTYIGQEEYQR